MCRKESERLQKESERLHKEGEFWKGFHRICISERSFFFLRGSE